jgi:hypothetical protein
MRMNEDALDELGDLLFLRVRDAFPDARIIVFTGYADIPLFQEAMQGSGQFPIRTADPIDRITVLTKDQSLEFQNQVLRFWELLRELDDIEIYPDTCGRPNSDIDIRCLRRVAYEYEAVSLVPTSLTGGLSGAKVWKCRIYQDQGHIADVVVKQVKKDLAFGGLQDLLPLNSGATSRGNVAGLTGGHRLGIQRLAGSDVEALSALILSDSERASACVTKLAATLSVIDEHQKTIPLAELAGPLIEWDSFVAMLTKYGLPIPSPSMRISSKIGQRHGDLHPSNVMVDGTNPVLIDFDSSCFSSAMLDPVTLLVSTLIHEDSPIRANQWPSVAEIRDGYGSANFGANNPASSWFDTIWTWICQCQTSDREFWALSLLYSARQLQYPDVISSPEVLERVLALAEVSADRVRAS